MDFSGEYRVPAPRNTVWEALNDPDVLQHCIDGCESFERLTESTFQAKIKAKVGPVSARFVTTVTLSEMDPPSSYLISGQGQGGAAGFAKGSARVTLVEADQDVTTLTYESQATVGGKLASVGGRLIKGVAEKTAEDFFRRFTEHLTDDGRVLEKNDEPIEVPADHKKRINADTEDDEDDGPGVFEKLATIELTLKEKLTLAGLALLMVAMVVGTTVAVLR